MKRSARYISIGGVMVLVIAAAGLLLRAQPLGQWVLFVLISALLAYSGGYFWARKVRVSESQRNTVLAAALVLAIILLVIASRLAYGRVSQFLLIATGGAVLAAHVLGLALGLRKRRRPRFLARESALAHRYLDGLRGVEIGGSIHNPFGLNTLNADYTSSTDTTFKQAEIEIADKTLPVDIVASADALPLRDKSVDFVVSSHVLEHLPDPIKTLKEWYRVIRPGGYIFMIIPHKERIYDRDLPRIALAELIHRHKTGEVPDTKGH